MRRCTLLVLTLVSLLGACAATAQTTRDSLVCARCVADTTKVADSTVARVDTTWNRFLRDSITLRDSVVKVPIVVVPPPTGTHELPGMRTILEADFAATKLPAAYASAPNATYGITAGKWAVPHQSNKSVPGEDSVGWAHRCTFTPLLKPGRGPGCFFQANENLPQNTSSINLYSYRYWYETGRVRFGGVNGEPGFENVASDGIKLFGYFGGMCTGSVLGDQMILWASPYQWQLSRGKVKVHDKWQFQIRWNGACNNGNWPTIRPPGWPTFTAGPYFTYELLLDAGDIDTPNGSVTVWVDGVQKAKWTGVIRTAKAYRGWFSRHWNPVMNGDTLYRKTRTDVLDLDYYRASVLQRVDSAGKLLTP